MARILVVDDEEDLLWALQQSLSDDGHQVLVAHDGLEALAIARRHRPDVVILDIVMPRLDGLEVCQGLRRDDTLEAVPIIFLSVRDSIEDRVLGLDRGGDDYLVKPFDLEELKARVRALLRRRRLSLEEARSGRRSPLVVGPLALDLGARKVRVGETDIPLTPAEFDLLHHLMVHAGEAFSSEELLRQVWGYPPEAANSGLVRWHMKNLRSKIEPEPDHPVYIRTIPRHGYILDPSPRLPSRRHQAKRFQARVLARA